MRTLQLLLITLLGVNYGPCPPAQADNPPASWLPELRGYLKQRDLLTAKAVLRSGGEAELRAMGDRDEALLLGVAAREPELVRDLLRDGANPNTRDSDSYAFGTRRCGLSRLGEVSVLLLAVKHGDLSVAKLLLEAGADPNLRVNGRMALRWAKLGAKRYPAVLELLLQYGARE